MNYMSDDHVWCNDCKCWHPTGEADTMCKRRVRCDEAMTVLAGLLAYVDSLHPDNQIDTQPESQAARRLLEAASESQP